MGNSVNMDFSAQIQKGVSKAAKELLDKKQQDQPSPAQGTQDSTKDTQTAEAVKKNNAMLSQFFDKANEGTRGGGAAGSQIEEDLNELRSGRFAGIFIRAKDTIKSLKDTGKEIFGNSEKMQTALSSAGAKPAESGLDLPGTESLPKMDIPDPMSDSAKPQERERFAGLKAIQEETANKLAKSKADTMNYFSKTLFGEGEEHLAQVRGAKTGTDSGLPGMIGGKGSQQMRFMGRVIYEKAEFKKVEIAKTAGAGLFGQGQSGKGGMPGSGNNAQAAGEGLSDSLAKGGLVLGGIAAGIVKLGSSLAGMYQQALESQDKTLDSMGYVRSGGALTSNAEMAQIGLSRAKILGGEGQAQLNNKLGVQFGLRQGIGGSEGAEIFAKLNKYGGFKESKEDFKEILAQGIKGGFEGQRQSEMFSKIASMNEESARAGFGKGNAVDLASVIAGISARGIGADNSLTMTENINKKFQEEGDLFNSIVLSSKMQEYQNQGMDSSESYIKAMAFAQDPTNMKANMGLVSSTLKSSGMADSDIGVILQKQQVATAKQLEDSKTATTKKDPKTGEVTQDGTYNIMDMGQDDFKASTNDYKKATQEFSKTVKVGQSYRATKNAIDNLVVGSAVAQTAYMTQLKITTGMIDFLGKADSNVAGAASEFSQGNIRKGLGTLVGGKEIASDDYQNKLKKTYEENGGGIKGGVKAIGQYYSDLFGAKKDPLTAANKAAENPAAVQIAEKDKTSKETALLLKGILDTQNVTVELAAKQLNLNESQLKEMKNKYKLWK